MGSFFIAFSTYLARTAHLRSGAAAKMRLPSRTNREEICSAALLPYVSATWLAPNELSNPPRRKVADMTPYSYSYSYSQYDFLSPATSCTQGRMGYEP